MVVGAKVCELTDGFLWSVWGLYVGILTSPLRLTSGLGKWLRSILYRHWPTSQISL